MKDQNSQAPVTFKVGNVRYYQKGNHWFLEFTEPETGKSKRIRLKKGFTQEEAKKKAKKRNKKLSTASSESKTLKETIEAFLRAKETSLTPKALQRLLSSYKAFMGFLEGQGVDDSRVDQISKEEIRGFQDHRLTEGRSPNTVNTDVQNLQALFEYGIKNGFTQTNPALCSKDASKGLVTLLKPQESFNGLSPKSLSRLLKVIRKQHRGLYLTLLLQTETGIPFELASRIRFDDFDEARQTVTCPWDEYGIPNSTLDLPVSNKWKKGFLKIENQTGYISSGSDGPMTNSEASKITDTCFNESGICRIGLAEGLKIFQIAFITKALRENLCIGTIMKLTGPKLLDAVLHHMDIDTFMIQAYLEELRDC